MTTRKLEKQYSERQDTMRKKILPVTVIFWALLWSPSEWVAQDIKINDGDTTEVVKKDSTDKKGGMISIDWIKTKWDNGISIEPDLDDDKDQWTLWSEGWDGSKKTKEKTESPTKFSRQSWVWYSITGWDALRVNRFMWSGKLFKGKLWEISVTWIADLDNPLHTNWSWKLILWKQLYKGFSLDWDYTFTWAWNNIFRFGMWYGGKLWDGSYGVNIFPLNTNGSPISAKVTFRSKVWKNWFISSFVFVDFDTNWYYSETEYVHQLAQWVAAFVQARLMWTMDGKFTGADGQTLMWWLKFDL